jgi:alanine racemase
MPATPFQPVSNCWAEIDLGALAANAAALRGLGAELMAVVKADAYGHGVAIVVPELLRAGLRDFGVATVAEGVLVRGIAGPEPQIYVMTAIGPQDAAQVVASDLTPFVSSAESAEAIGRAAMAAGRKARVHVEVDTGIGRAGALPSEAPEIVARVLTTHGLLLTGLCTHFAWGENATDARRQHAIFEQVLRGLPPELLSGLVIHAANSPAVLNVPGARYNMIRPGLLLFGIAPEGGSPAAMPDGTPLAPVLSLRARVLLVRRMPAGTTLSYGRTFTLDHQATIATVGIGYGDGYSRRLSNNGQVLLPGGIVAPIRGRVCMDQICVEVPEGVSIAAGDTVTLVGKSGSAELRAADIADSIGATPHEITTCMTVRVVRVAV